MRDLRVEDIYREVNCWSLGFEESFVDGDREEIWRDEVRGRYEGGRHRWAKKEMDRFMSARTLLGMQTRP